MLQTILGIAEVAVHVDGAQSTGGAALPPHAHRMPPKRKYRVAFTTRPKHDVTELMIRFTSHCIELFI